MINKFCNKRKIILKICVDQEYLYVIKENIRIHHIINTYNNILLHFYCLPVFVFMNACVKLRKLYL